MKCLACILNYRKLARTAEHAGNYDNRCREKMR